MTLRLCRRCCGPSLASNWYLAIILVRLKLFLSQQYLGLDAIDFTDYTFMVPFAKRKIVVKLTMLQEMKLAFGECVFGGLIRLYFKVHKRQFEAGFR